MTETTAATHDGLLLVDKTAGCTSHDMVQQARRALRLRRIGHCGTLDPTATGLLLLTVGRATRLTRFLIRAPKVYEGKIQLGIATDTYDAAGQVVSETPVTEPSIADLDFETLRSAMSDFEGAYQQVPPPYSAKKIRGKKFYELARQGAEVPSEPSEVQVFEFVPLDSPQAGCFGFRLSCSSGTYARTLAHELGRGLGVGGHLCQLVRTRIGDFSLTDAVSGEALSACEAQPESLGSAWIRFDDIPLPFATIALDLAQERRILNGQTALVADLQASEGDWLKLLSPRRQFVAVGTVAETIGERGLGVVQPKIVFK